MLQGEEKMHMGAPPSLQGPGFLLGLKRDAGLAHQDSCVLTAPQGLSEGRGHCSECGG